MATYTVIWKMENEPGIMSDTVVMDNRVDELIETNEDYEILMYPLLCEFTCDYTEDGEIDAELAKAFMHQATIIAIFRHEDCEVIDYANSTDELINVIFEPPTVKNTLHVVH